MLEKLNFFNKIVVRLTWFFLIIGIVDHWVFEFLPFPWAARNINLLWVLIAVLIVGELIAYVMKRRAPKEDAAT